MERRRLGDIATYVNGFEFKPEDRGTEGKHFLISISSRLYLINAK